jgi:hypothetical protein
LFVKIHIILTALLWPLNCCAIDSAWWKPYSDDANTLGLWHFNDVINSSTVFLDDDSLSSSRNNNGSKPAYSTLPVSSGAGFGEGADAFGLALKGSGCSWQHVIPDDNGDMEPTGSDMSIEAWICPENSDLSGIKGIVNKGGSSMFNFFLYNGKAGADFRTPNYQYVLGTATLQSNVWVHIAFTYDYSNRRAKIYINGKMECESQTNGYLANNNSPLAIGVVDNSANTYSNFAGAIDEIRYSKIVRTFSTYASAGSCSALGLWLADLNNDCIVDFRDFASLACQYMNCTNPAGC